MSKRKKRSRSNKGWDEVPNVELGRGKPYKIFGSIEIDDGSIQQMDTAMRLPISVKGALMPDAHQGYGLPIGGVLAADNAIIPYGVGMDIGCRMCLSVYDIPVSYLKDKKSQFQQQLIENTRFGQAEFTKPEDDAVMERKEFKEIDFLRSLKSIARSQLGTSGSGNHFVEFGMVEFKYKDPEFNLPPGKYFGLLSHSGSRRMGALIAQHYTALAMEICRLPREARHLAWFDLNSAEGQEYWQAMELAGAYSSANHNQLHKRISKALNEKAILMVENHHNFAWKEKLADGKEVIIHRKGATPAAENAIGMIPGSMTLPGFLVRGKGNDDSMNSASHGAGRVMSRKKATIQLSKSDMIKELGKHGVTLIGGGLDEAPMAYKDIYQVMKYQEELVEIIAAFYPKIVRMEGPEKFI